MFFPINEVEYNNPDFEKMCGDGRIEKLKNAPESPKFRAIYVKFTKGAYTKWHYHTGDQLLLGAEGVGFVEFRDSSVVTLNVGDRVIIPANVWHRHGAIDQDTFIHLAVTRGATTWEEDDPCEKDSQT